jgi:hypothetical protein
MRPIVIVVLFYVALSAALEASVMAQVNFGKTDTVMPTAKEAASETVRAIQSKKLACIGAVSDAVHNSIEKAISEGSCYTFVDGTGCDDVPFEGMQVYTDLKSKGYKVQRADDDPYSTSYTEYEITWCEDKAK